MRAPSELPEIWRGAADTLEPYTAPAARAFRQAADDLERALNEWFREPLTITEAAAESGYSRDSLLRWLREGRLWNYGTEEDPRIRRDELPRKLGHRAAAPEDTPAVAPIRPLRASSASQAVRSVIGS